MMRRLYILVLFLCIIKICSAQQMPLFSQYFFNQYIINPAVAGISDKETPLQFSIHKQWINIEESPATQILSLHHQLDSKESFLENEEKSAFESGKMGFGGLLYHDSFGASRQLGVNVTYAYHLLVNDKAYVSVGLSGVLMQYSLNLKQEDFGSYEPSLYREKMSEIVPEVNFGLFAYRKQNLFDFNNNYWWAGISIFNLVQKKLHITVDYNGNNKLSRHYYLMGGYRFSFASSREIQIEPSTLIKFTATTPLQVDVNLRMIYKDNFWTGVSVRANDSFVALMGIKHKEYEFGISYDFTFSDISKFTTGSQEIIFIWNIPHYKERAQSFM